MTTTPEDYFLKTWKVVDGGGTDVHPGERVTFKKLSGKLQLNPSGLGDGLWSQYQDLRYVGNDGTTCPDQGYLSCEYPHARQGAVTVSFYKFSKAGIRCRVIPKGLHSLEDPGEWTAEEEGGP